MNEIHKSIRHKEIKLKLEAKLKDLDFDEYKKRSSKLTKLYSKQSNLKTRIWLKYPKNTDIEKLDVLWAYAVFERPKGKIFI